eukprot:1470673-Amphidinium_carterae.1
MASAHPKRMSLWSLPENGLPLVRGGSGLLLRLTCEKRGNNNCTPQFYRWLRESFSKMHCMLVIWYGATVVELAERRQPNNKTARTEQSLRI